MSRSRYRPPVSHSLVRRLHRHERRERMSSIVADYDRRIAAAVGLEWHERRWDPTMRGGYSRKERRYLREVRQLVMLKRAWARRRTIVRYRITVNGIEWSEWFAG